MGANYFTSSEYEFYLGKVPYRTYVSKRINYKKVIMKNEQSIEKTIPLRYASKVIDTENAFGFIKEKKEIRLRISDGERQEITAKFLEDNRGIYVLQIQKYTVSTGAPHQTYFSFRGDEIDKLLSFIKSIPELHIENEQGFKINDEELKKLLLTKQQAYSIYKDNQEIFSEILKQNINQDDVKNLVYKKNQLEYFENLVNDEAFFQNEKKNLGIQKDESLWQNFFEQNTWIFGFGLQYIINIPLQDRKLEQVVEGFDVINRGKRVDALMKSKGIISSLCFAEIKTHKTKLLNSDYRPSVYPPSNELSGGIAQIQRTVQSSIDNLGNKLSPTYKNGNPTGEDIFMYHPKSFLLIGQLDEFISENGINKDKFSSFEMYRKSLKDIEVITFDELLERAKYIIQTNEN